MDAEAVERLVGEFAATRRRFDMISEGLRSEIRQVADGVAGVSSGLQHLRSEVKDEFTELRMGGLGTPALKVGRRLALVGLWLAVLLATGSPAAAARRVFLLVFDPVVPVAGQPKLHEHFGWNDPYSLATQYRGWINSLLGPNAYVVALTQEVDGIPVKADGYQYDLATYLDCIQGVPGACHAPDLADYGAMVADHGLCDALDAGQIDEVWMFGGPYFGFWESTLAGPGAFWYNSPPVTGTSCDSLLPVMGYNYERGLPEMVHNLGHRFESTMVQVYGSWGDNLDHNWNRFALVSSLFPYSGCGDTHFPPNGTSDYDYGNLATIDTFCQDFANYPNLAPDPTAVLQPVDCTAWGCTQLGYLTWWFGWVPHVAGVGPDGKLNNWWSYIVDPNVALSGIFVDGFESGDTSGWSSVVP